MGEERNDFLKIIENDSMTILGVHLATPLLKKFVANAQRYMYLRPNAMNTKIGLALFNVRPAYSDNSLLSEHYGILQTINHIGIYIGLTCGLLYKLNWQPTALILFITTLM